MNNHELTWYLQEIVMHAHGATADYKRLREAIYSEELRQTSMVWYRLTSILGHSAMISKFTKPIRNSAVATQRKENLREILKIDDKSEILSRDARDNVEHFDERIDNWVGGDVGLILEAVLDDREAFQYQSRNGTGEIKIKRVLLIDCMTFISENRAGETFELLLEPLNCELTRIESEGRRWLETSSPYGFIFPQAD